jgi:hypothetical protein
MSQPLVKIAGTSLETVRARVPLPAEATTAIADCADVAAAVDRLEAAGFLLEATRFVAHALPKREAVWWACMCATHTAPADLPEPDRKAREAAENWVRQQGDKPRRAAWELAEGSGFGTPEAWCAVGAFWCGDSMAPEGQPAVPPAPHLPGTAVAGAVALAAVRGDVTRQQARLHSFLESGRNIAAGGPGRLPAETA